MTELDDNRCFVLRPFDSTLQNVWDLAIRPAIESAGLEPWDGQEERLGSNIIHRDISNLVWNCRLIIAELTGRNPNVMYELGMAHAAKKPVILLLEKNETPPFDVTHIRYLKYDKYNLRALRNDLSMRILSTLSMENDQIPDLFPELEIVTPSLRRELSYLRTHATGVKVILIPECADLFLNDSLVGTGSTEILVNPFSPSNTISASTVGFFEHHGRISTEEIEKGTVSIALEKVYQPGVDMTTRLSKRVPRWLRDRRRDPHNPVLMRAISSYLMTIGEKSDALEEIKDLVEVAPSWFMSINQLGFFHGSAGEWDRALPYYHQVAAMKPDHFIGHFNLACVYALQGDLRESLTQLRKIVSHPKAAASIRETMNQLSHDPDFRNLIEDGRLSAEYREIELTLFPGAKDYDWRTASDSGYYTF